MRYTLEYGSELIPVEVTAIGADRYRVRIGEGEPRVVDARVGEGQVHLLDGLRSRTVSLAPRADGQHAELDGLDRALNVLDRAAARRRAAGGTASGKGGGVVRSPMPGRVVKLLVTEGDAVQAGQGVVIVEAMKMENELRAEIDGVVEAVHVAPDDRVDGNAELVTIAPLEGAR